MSEAERGFVVCRWFTDAEGVRVAVAWSSTPDPGGVRVDVGHMTARLNAGQVELVRDALDSWLRDFRGPPPVDPSVWPDPPPVEPERSSFWRRRGWR